MKISQGVNYKLIRPKKKKKKNNSENYITSNKKSKMIFILRSSYMSYSKVKLVTVVEGDQKAPFQWLLHRGEGATLFPRITPLYP